MKTFVLAGHPLTIVVPKEREALYNRLQQKIRELEAMVADQGLSQKERLQAMSLIIRTAQVMAGVLKAAEIEQVEKDIAELKKAVDEEIRKQDEEDERAKYS